MLKCLLFVFPLLVSSLVGVAQNTITSGNWSDPTVWSGGAVPAAGGTVNVNNPLTITTNLSPTGIWTYNSNTTDQPGGTAFTFNPAAGTNTITISSGVTVTFEGGSAGTPNQFNSGTISIFGTLILGYTDLNNSGNLNVTVQPGGTLIINGDLVNKNNAGTLTVNGAIIVNGNFNNQTGSVTVGGSGTIDATGTITSNGGSTVFGTTNDCTTGPCSGTTLACTFTNTVSPTSQVLCSGSTAGTFTATTNGGTPTYLWESSTTSSSSGFATAAGTSSNSTYTSPAGLTVTTWYRVAITSGGCTSRSAPVKVTVLSGGGWKGTTNNWGTASNWCSNSVPTSATDVVINPFPSGSGLFMPVIASATNATVFNLTINTGASLTVNIGGSLSLSGDFTNNGTFTDNSNTAATGVILAGSSVQTIAGSTANVFNNLTLSNSSSSTPAINFTTNNFVVNSNLTMSSGIINLNGFTVTLGASAAGSGTLAYGSGRFYGGNIERWFPTASVTIGSVVGLFPIGTSTDYRPLFLGNAGLTAGGTIKIRHTSTSGSSSVSFADGASTVAVRSNSFWTVTTANSIGTGTHSLRTEGTGFGTVGAVTDLRQTLVGGVVGTAGTNAGTTTNPQVNRTGLTTANLSNNFYWGSVNATNTPLPISLVLFNGQQVSDQIHLKWKTLSELNFNFFSLEKSIDGKEFSEIAQVTGNGTTKEEHTYESVDEAPLLGKNYYRLKSVDFDGYTEYFSVISVDFSNEKQFTVFPNPSKGESITARINFQATEQSTIVVFNSLGVIVGRYDLIQPEATVKFPVTLPSGVYHAKFFSPSFSRVVRFVVNE